MTLAQLLLLAFAATVGGALNSVVGGGSFVAFPALLFAGVAPVSANATTTLCLWPAALASTVAYRRELDSTRRILLPLAIASFVGGGLGAWLLLRTSNTTFMDLVPWLMLFASTLFTFGGSAITRLHGHRVGDGNSDDNATHSHPYLGVFIQLVVSIYGGYFGGGMGIMMLAAWSLLGMTNIHVMNALRSLLGTIINGIALVAFIVAHAIAWEPGIIMVVCASISGYFGAALARRVDPKKVKVTVTVVAWGMTAWFFVREWHLV